MPARAAHLVHTAARLVHMHVAVAQLENIKKTQGRHYALVVFQEKRNTPEASGIVSVAGQGNFRIVRHRAALAAPLDALLPRHTVSHA